jgi:hypothetical protein
VFLKLVSDLGLDCQTDSARGKFFAAVNANTVVFNKSQLPEVFFCYAIVSHRMILSATPVDFNLQPLSEKSNGNTISENVSPAELSGAFHWKETKCRSPRKFGNFYLNSIRGLGQECLMLTSRALAWEMGEVKPK